MALDERDARIRTAFSSRVRGNRVRSGRLTVMSGECRRTASESCKEMCVTLRRATHQDTSLC